jgi:hypothetical protein
MFRPEDIQALVRQRPFRPLRIVTSSGETFDVRHPELLMVGVRDLVIGRASARDPRQYEQVTHVSLLHVTAVETQPVTGPAAPGDDTTAS